jgi:hypothetical protein
MDLSFDSLTFEFAEFTVPPESEAAMLAEREAMTHALGRTFPGAIAAWLTRKDDGSWIDVILWRSRPEAEAAAARIHEVPEAERWFRHIAKSKGVRHADVAHQAIFRANPPVASRGN